MSKKEVVRKSKIEIEVGLNEENVPVAIHWQAQDNPSTPTPQPCKAMLLSLFDSKSLETLKIDLWTTDLQVMEMDRLVYYTMRSLADTYFKATQNNQLASEMQQFAKYFGEKTEILKPGN
jgi:gliding motility-associated protein GldC